MAEGSVNTSRIRDQDWLFNALWVACGDRRVPKCVLNIPATIIFRDGMPFKGVCTISGGSVERINLGDERYIERDLGESVGFQAPRDLKLRALRRILVDYAIENKYDENQRSAEEPFLCKVRQSIIRVLAVVHVCVCLSS